MALLLYLYLILEGADVKTHCNGQVIDYRMIQLVDIETIDRFEL